MSLKKTKNLSIVTLILVSLIFISCGGSGGSSTDTEETLPESACPLGSEIIKIMPIGDSITEGEGGHDTYRRDLYRKLTTLGCSIDFVGSKSGVRDGSVLNSDFDLDHEGYWGYRIDQLLSFIGARVGTYQPDIALVHLGSNDIFQDQSVTGTIDELSSLIDQLRLSRPGMKIFLAQIIPSRRNNEKITEFNREVLTLGETKRDSLSPLFIVDQNTNYLVSDNYDGTHPSSVGEVKIAENWYREILDSL